MIEPKDAPIYAVMNEDIEAMIKYRDDVTSSKEKAIVALQKAGIMDEQGEIVEIYRDALYYREEAKDE